MKVVESKDALRRACSEARTRGQIIGLVPTMGYLHEGHLSLVRLARRKCGLLIVSIFVNPSQFSPGEDYSNYPRNFDRDRHLLEEQECDICFTPSAEEMYPANHDTWVEVEGLSRVLCGKSRPQHFRGVTTVVAKLLNIVRPDVAVFGAKDAQQALVIGRMVRDLDFGVEVVVAPTVREPDGLAMSSRNEYLTPTERRDATVLYRSLKRAEELIKAGERDPNRVVSEMTSMIEGVRTSKIDYVSIVDIEDLQELETLKGEILIGLAVWFGKARLIDNTIVQVR